jgi:hypothetical protein
MVLRRPVELAARPRKTLGFQTPPVNFNKVLQRPVELTALIVQVRDPISSNLVSGQRADLTNGLESTGLIKEVFMTRTFLVTVSARVFVYNHFACEGAVDVRGVSGSKDHSYNPPDQPDLQAVVTCFGGSHRQ